MSEYQHRCARYWSDHCQNGSDWHRMHDACFEAIGQSLSIKQLEIVFMTLPLNIFEQVERWGLSDTEVADKIFEYVRKNKASICKAVDIQTTPI